MTRALAQITAVKGSGRVMAAARPAARVP
jgi:hypothetical protein